MVLKTPDSMKSTTSIPIRVLTHNIRYATQSPFKGEEFWSVRRNRFINELKFHTFYNQESSICLQEVLHTQLMDIFSGLNNGSRILHTTSPDQEAEDPGWTYIGVGRDDGLGAGEYSPILYRPAVWELEHFRTVWLSETPWKPSKSWDAASIRILTIGVFKHRQSRKLVMAMNTHLDDQGSKSRMEASKIIIREIETYLNRDFPNRISGTFLAGDLNSKPSQEAYQILNDTASPVADLERCVISKDHYGHEATFTGFGFEREPPKRIDFIHLGRQGKVPETEVNADGSSKSKRQPWAVQGYSVLENKFDDGVYISDHRAVVGDLVLMI